MTAFLTLSLPPPQQKKAPNVHSILFSSLCCSSSHASSLKKTGVLQMPTFPCNSISLPSSLILFRQRGCSPWPVPLNSTAHTRLYSGHNSIPLLVFLLFKKNFKKILNSHITDPSSFILTRMLSWKQNLVILWKRRQWYYTFIVLQ